MMYRKVRGAPVRALVLLLGVLAACSESPMSPQAESLAPQVSAVPTAVDPLPDVTTYEGVIGGRNLYEILVPANWNGELVLYAHGFVDPAEPIRIPDKDNIDLIRDQLVAEGYAFAYCSFRENGFAVRDGAWSTRQVHQIFRSKVKQAPAYTWLVGQSLGALVAVELTETHPSEFDGVVTAGGMLGGSRAELDFMGDVRILFDLFYPGVLPGSVCEPVVVSDPELEIIMPVIAAITADPSGFGVIAATLPLAGTDPNAFVQSLVTALVFNHRGLPDLLERTNGACPTDNCERVYTERIPGTLPPGTLDLVNAVVPRYCRSTPTDLLLQREYEPTGRLSVEMITLHLMHDPIVPVFHEQLYGEKVAASGSAHLLEQRILPGYGHTLEIDPAQIFAALQDLRAKVLPASPAFAR